MTPDNEAATIAAKLTRAQREWLVANEDGPDTPLPETPNTCEWSEGDAEWNALAELSLCEWWTTRLTPLGLRVRKFLQEEGQRHHG